MNKSERVILFLGVLFLGLFSILFCTHSVAISLIPVRVSYWIYWIIYSVFLVYVNKKFVDNYFSIINFIIFPIITIGIKFIIDLIIFKFSSNVIDLLLEVYYFEIEAFLFQLLLIILLFFVLGKKKCFNNIFEFKKPLFVLCSGIVIYIIIAVLFRMQDPIDKTLNLERNISYHLMLQMRNINFIFNLIVLPCLWIIFRNLTSEKK